MISKLLIALAFVVTALPAASSYAQNPRGVVDLNLDDAPEMKPLTEDDAKAVFGSLIDAKLVPLQQTDRMLDERLSNLEKLSPITTVKTVATQSKQVQATSTSNCPGCVCPTNQPVKIAPAKQPVKIAPAQNQGHWTFPGGNISAHLNSDHQKIDTRGMTQEQMLTLHDSLHKEAQAKSAIAQPVAPRNTSSVSKSVTTPYRQVQTTATSNCPGGVCPAPGRSYAPRFRLFGR